MRLLLRLGTKMEKNKPISLASKVEGNCNCHEKEKKKTIIDSNGFKIESTKPIATTTYSLDWLSFVDCRNFLKPKLV